MFLYYMYVLVYVVEFVKVVINKDIIVCFKKMFLIKYVLDLIILIIVFVKVIFVGCGVYFMFIKECFGFY